VVNGIRYYSWSGTGILTTSRRLDSGYGPHLVLLQRGNDGLVESLGSSHWATWIRDNYFQNHLDDGEPGPRLVSIFESSPASIFRSHATGSRTWACRRSGACAC